MNKFIKPTIQNKMLLAILPLLIIQVVIVGVITLFFVFQQFNLSINQYNQQRENDLLTLIENPDIVNYLQNKHYGLDDEADIYKLNLEELFKRLVKRTRNNKGDIYENISFINKNGLEIAKVDSRKNSKDYLNLSMEDFFIKAKNSKQNKVYKNQISTDQWIVFSPLFLDTDGDGIREFSGVVILKYIYSVEDFIKAAILSLLMTVSLVLIGIAIIYSTIRVVKRLIEPIHELVDATRSLSTGNLKVRANLTAEDEIGQLAQSFNRMANDLEESIEELQEYKNELEIKVAQRTEELEKSNIELSEAYKQLKETQAQLIHSEKMASLGQLVAGVAHELNNPINFIYGNMPHLKNYIGDFKKILGEFEQFQLSLESKKHMDDLKEEMNWEFLVTDLDLLISDCQNGAKRAKQIVQDLKNFSRLGEADFKESDIHEGIDSTLNLLANLYRNRIKVLKEYGDFGKVKCFPEQLNQVFMNLLSNAAQAMPKEKIDNTEATVWITTFREKDFIKIIFKDNAGGIDQAYLKKIFDPFFTTKPVGEGTGLGLSITYGIIDKHGGTITVDSKLGEGSTFTITLPVNPNVK